MAAQASKGRMEPHASPLADMPGGPPAAFAPRHFSLAEVRQLIALMDTSDLVEITIETEQQGTRLVLRKSIEVVATAVAGPPAAAPLPAASAQTPAAAPATAEHEQLAVTAPLVGVWFPAMRAGHKPLVTVGDVVREGQVIGAIETLRVMNEVESPHAGKVRAILVKPGQPVEYGQPLIELDPASDQPGA